MMKRRVAWTNLDFRLGKVVVGSLGVCAQSRRAEQAEGARTAHGGTKLLVRGLAHWGGSVTGTLSATWQGVCGSNLHRWARSSDRN